MISSSIWLIIFIFIVIGIIAYFYYHYHGDSSGTEDNKVVLDNQKFIKNPYKKNMGKVKNKSSCKPVNISTLSKFSQDSSSKINIDNVLARMKEKSVSNYPISVSASFTDVPSETIKKYHNNIFKCSKMKSHTSSNELDPEAIWNSNFGEPLVSQEEKKLHTSKMEKDHQDYIKSLGKFVKYKTDNGTVIRTDITIDPFKQKDIKSLNGKTIKDIYDEQVAGPSFVKKKIRGKTKSTIVYDDESEMNGGQLKGTNLYGFDGAPENYKMAKFGNEF